MRRRPYALIVPAAVVLLALAGCTPGTTGPTATNIPGETLTPRPTSTSTATVAPTSTAAPGTPVTVTCTQLLSPQDIYDFNPNFGVAPNYAPKAGTPQKAAVDDGGIACGWSNQTSGDLIELAVSHPSAEHLTELRTQAAASLSAVPTYGTPPAVDGFFAQKDDAGSLQVFTDTYALVGSSTAFFEPGDAAQLVQAALSHLS